MVVEAHRGHKVDREHRASKGPLGLRDLLVLKVYKVLQDHRWHKGLRELRGP